MLWCRDLVDIYFLQIQGSGKADLGDGNIVSILYDGQNGRQYKSLGKSLIDKGAIAKEKHIHASDPRVSPNPPR